MRPLTIIALVLAMAAMCFGADYGDRLEDSTVDLFFSTVNTSAVPTTLSGTPVLSVYKDSLTQYAVPGAALDVDFDSVTGYNHVTIDTSLDVFFTAGADYAVVITTGTVGGTSVVGAVVGTFSIENRFDEVDVTAIGGDIQSATDLKDFADAGYDPATDKVQGVVLADTTTTNTDMRGTDSALLASSAPTNFGDLAITATTGRVDVGEWLGVAVTALETAADIWAESSRTLTALDEDTTTIDLDGSNVGGIAGTINTLDGLDTAQDTQHSTTQTAVAAVETDTQDLQAKIGTPVALDTGAATVGGMLAKMADDAGGATFDATDDSLNAIADGGGGGLDAAGVRAAIGMAAANLDNQLTAINSEVVNIDGDAMRGTDSAATASALTIVDNEIAAIQAEVDNLDGDAMRGTDSALLASAMPTNWSSMVISAGGAVDSLVQGFLNTLGTETNAGDVADSFFAFLDVDPVTAQTVDDVGSGAGGSFWSTGEQAQIRYRLAMDGTQTNPTTNNGTIEEIAGDTDEIQTDLANGGRLDLLIDAIVAAATAIELDTDELQTNQGDWVEPPVIK